MHGLRHNVNDFLTQAPTLLLQTCVHTRKEPRKPSVSSGNRCRTVHSCNDVLTHDRGRAEQSAWILLGMPLPAASAAKHSCATTAEVKILHWGPSHVQMTTPPAAYLLTQDHWIRTLSAAHGGPAMSSRRRQREYARYGSPAAPHLRRQRTTGPQRAHAPEAPRARS